ncbi:MAG: PHP domain-containing protein [Lentisphaeria bacterium]|nr:PHP domain-containing protein [Lentisphaeria bacterium]
MRFDLHVHTALSACAENIMSPARIIEKAVSFGLDMIAVTDHNASAHALLTRRLGERVGVHVVVGMEVTSKEEVHALALFDELDGLDALQSLVDEHLPDQLNDAEHFGLQLLYDENDEIVDVDEQLRQVGTSLGLDTICEAVHGLGGSVVPAHIFRSRNSVTSQLGFVNPDGDYDALEVSVRTWRREGCGMGQKHGRWALLAGTDSHFVEDVGRFCMTVPGSFDKVGDVIRVLDDAAEV